MPFCNIQFNANCYKVSLVAITKQRFEKSLTKICIFILRHLFHAKKIQQTIKKKAHL